MYVYARPVGMTHYTIQFRSQGAARDFEAEIVLRGDVYGLSREFHQVKFIMQDSRLGRTLAKDFEQRWIAARAEKRAADADAAGAPLELAAVIDEPVLTLTPPVTEQLAETVITEEVLPEEEDILAQVANTRS